MSGWGIRDAPQVDSPAGVQIALGKVILGDDSKPPESGISISPSGIRLMMGLHLKSPPLIDARVLSFYFPL